MRNVINISTAGWVLCPFRCIDTIWNIVQECTKCISFAAYAYYSF